ncbi:MAG: Rieske 2Fe-2S domain-containing protein [Hyphomicrobiaceae bacterium]
MMSAEQNERLTRVSSGTPCGNLMRQYWHPAALSEELASERPVVPVRLLGQNLVLFRDDKGRLGLIDRDCPHRGADLAFGRLEDGGLRCVFHGWLFDVTGQCIEMPAEPASSRFCELMRQKSYPVQERNGIVFAYLGEGEPPAVPALDCFAAPDAYTFAFKGLWECNWLQALEVGLDPAHASYLHRFFEDEKPEAGYGLQFRDRSSGSDLTMIQVLREHARPVIEPEKTDFGMRIVTTREISADDMHVRVTNCIFPHAINLPLSTDMVLTQFHVPIDDANTYWYSMFTSFSHQVDKALMREQRIGVIEPPLYKSKFNKSNDYGFNAREQATRTYTGMGEDINVHDQFAVESLGPIQNRMREHLGQSDRAIIAYRRMLTAAIADVEAGRPGPMRPDLTEAARISGPSTIDTVAPRASWQTHWPAAYRMIRDAAQWAKSAA